MVPQIAVVIIKQIFESHQGLLSLKNAARPMIQLFFNMEV